MVLLLDEGNQLKKKHEMLQLAADEKDFRISQLTNDVQIAHSKIKSFENAIDL